MTGEVTAHAKNNLATWMLEHPLEDGEGEADTPPPTAAGRGTAAPESQGRGHRRLRFYGRESSSSGAYHCVLYFCYALGLTEFMALLCL